MVHVAKEMKRRGFELPLMIGGATTSKAHTAVKIEPQYDKGVVYVNNASRAVGVVSNLLSKDHKAEFLAKTTAEYDKVREQQARKKPRSKPVTIQRARDNAAKLDWDNYTPPVPKKLGVTEFKNVSISTLRKYIDWTPYFMTWSIAGKYPRILTDEVVGEQAQSLFKDANDMLDELEKSGTLQPLGVIGLFPANRVGDDIEIYTDETRKELLTTSCHLRQQTEKTDFANYCLADYIAPKGTPDYFGAFAVTGGLEEDDLANAFDAKQDDYNKIM